MSERDREREREKERERFERISWTTLNCLFEIPFFSFMTEDFVSEMIKYEHLPCSVAGCEHTKQHNGRHHLLQNDDQEGGLGRSEYEAVLTASSLP